MLTLLDVLPYLRSHGLLPEAALLGGQVRVFDRSRRNQNFEVVTGTTGGFFIKQGVSRDGFSGVHREAKVYALLEQHPVAHSCMPEYVLYDEPQDILILRLVAGAADLRTLESHRTASGTRTAYGIGRALASLHTSVPLAAAQESLGSGVPGVMSAQRPGLALLRDFSAASIELIRVLQRDHDLVQQLELLRDIWAPSAIIHHDVRLENVVVRRKGTRPLLVDFETAAVGDPVWDLGACVGDYLGLWLLSIPGTADQLPEHSWSLARRPLSSVQPAIAALLEGYCRDSAISGALRDDLELRVARFAALKLVQLSLEQLQNAPTWTVTALAHLQVAANMLARPADGLTTLLGLERSAA